MKSILITYAVLSARDEITINGIYADADTCWRDFVCWMYDIDPGEKHELGAISGALKADGYRVAKFKIEELPG